MKSTLFLLALAVLPLGFVAPKFASAPTSAAATYKVDTVHSSALFRVKHMGASWFYGSFEKIDGSVTWDQAKPEDGKVEISIPVDSLRVKDKKLEGHLKSPDFFSAQEFPTLTFKSTKVAKKGDGLEITGDLTMRGKTKSVTLDASFVGASESPQGGARAGWETRFTVKRSDFGISYGLPDGVGDEVTLIISLEGVKS